MKVASAIARRRPRGWTTFGANTSLQIHDEDTLEHQLKMIEAHKNGILMTPVIILVVYGHLLISPQFWRVRHAAIEDHPLSPLLLRTVLYRKNESEAHLIQNYMQILEASLVRESGTHKPSLCTLNGNASISQDWLCSHVVSCAQTIHDTKHLTKSTSLSHELLLGTFTYYINTCNMHT